MSLSPTSGVYSDRGVVLVIGPECAVRAALADSLSRQDRADSKPVLLGVSVNLLILLIRRRYFMLGSKFFTTS